MEMEVDQAPEFKWEDALGSLPSLNLAAVTLGDYVMVMNGDVDLVMCEEPYVALQLWFNIRDPRSCKFIARIWNQGPNSIEQKIGLNFALKTDLYSILIMRHVKTTCL